MNTNEKWFKKLKDENIIEHFDSTFEISYRLKSCEFDIPDTIIRLLKKEYNAAFEQGGFFLAKPEKKSKKIVFTVAEVRFIKNKSSKPGDAYKKDPEEAEKVIAYAIANNLVPFIFHSHPTHSSHMLYEEFLYNKEMDTSDEDKFLSLFSGVTTEETKLRLPDVLVVVNGRRKGGVFIGFYGGLVSPLDFSERKQLLKNNLSSQIENTFEKMCSSPDKKILTLLGVAAVVYLFIKHPKTMVIAGLTTCSLMPSVAYTTSSINEFFGISSGFGLNIVLPQVADASIINDEKALNDIMNDYRKKYFGKIA